MDYAQLNRLGGSVVVMVYIYQDAHIMIYNLSYTYVATMKGYVSPSGDERSYFARYVPNIHVVNIILAYT